MSAKPPAKRVARACLSTNRLIQKYIFRTRQKIESTTVRETQFSKLVNFNLNKKILKPYITRKLVTKTKTRITKTSHCLSTIYNIKLNWSEGNGISKIRPFSRAIVSSECSENLLVRRRVFKVSGFVWYFVVICRRESLKSLQECLAEAKLFFFHFVGGDSSIFWSNILVYIMSFSKKFKLFFFLLFWRITTNFKLLTLL